jgi:hypothetical protein
LIYLKNISIPKLFGTKNKKIKNAYNFDNKDKINAKLYNLKAKITNKFNFDNKMEKLSMVNG